MDLEICADSVESAIHAEQGGAQRVELCCALSEGGLTPSRGAIRVARSSIQIGIHVMIRPRGGDFVYSPHELDIMSEDIAFAKTAGVDGVVLGLLNADGEIDSSNLKYLVQLAAPLPVTFHRAIDLADSMHRGSLSALETIIDSGARRILTSGAAQTAIQGSSLLKQLVSAAGSRIEIMAGGGVRAENVLELARQTGVTHFHAALRTPTPSPMRLRNNAVHLGDSLHDDYARFTTRVDDVRGLRQALAEAEIDSA